MRSEEVEAKLAQVRGWLADQGVEAVLLHSPAAFAWITGGGRGWVATDTERSVASVLVARDGAWVIASNIEAGRLEDEELVDVPLDLVEVPWHEEGAVAEAVGQRVNPSLVLSDPGQAGFPPAGPGLRRLRYRLVKAETARLRALGSDSAAALEEVAAGARPGDTEGDLAGRLSERCLAAGVVPTVVLVGVDGRIDRYRHPLPTTTRLRERLLMAVTGRRAGLHASLTRMVAFGRPDAGLLARHRAVARVEARMLLASRPGVPWSAAFAEGSDQYASEGFPDAWTQHHQGGLTGYAGREIKVTPATQGVIEEGSAVAWNPTLPGVKSEDTAIVGPASAEPVTSTPSWPRYTESLEAGRPEVLVHQEGPDR